MTEQQVIKSFYELTVGCMKGFESGMDQTFVVALDMRSVSASDGVMVSKDGTRLGGGKQNRVERKFIKISAQQELNEL